MAERMRPSELTVAECRMRAAYYREIAAKATVAVTRDALLRLAQQYERLAAGELDGG